MDKSEGRGGAPLSFFLRSSDLGWEVLVASKSKFWLRFGGTFPLTGYDEGC